MAVKLTILNGTDWVDGNVLYADDLIDTLTELQLFERVNSVVRNR